MKRLQNDTLKLNDFISDAALSSKMTGEEYSSIKTIHHSLLLGKHEVHEMNSLQVTAEDASFIFPELSKDMSQTVFGKATNVHFQVKRELYYQTLLLTSYFRWLYFCQAIRNLVRIETYALGNSWIMRDMPSLFYRKE